MESHRQDEPSTPNNKGHRRPNVLVGALLLVVGGVLLLRQLGFDFPYWFFTWPMLLVTIGFFVGIVNRFRDANWIVIMGVGLFFLADRVFPDINFSNFVLPVIILGVGLMVILAPRRWGRPPHLRFRGIRDRVGWEGKWKDYKDWNEERDINKEDIVDIVSVFGGARSTVYSKNFKGGESVSVFGGAEINLSQADFTGIIRLEVFQIFGGTKLVIPPHWEVRSEISSIFGGVDDKRTTGSITHADKVLILEGTSVFGGIEIRSY